MVCLFQFKQSANLQRPSKITLSLYTIQSNMVPDSAAAQTGPVKAPPSEAVFRASEITESDHQRARQSKRGENSKDHVTAERSLFISLIHLGKHVLDTKCMPDTC